MTGKIPEAEGIEREGTAVEVARLRDLKAIAFATATHFIAGGTAILDAEKLGGNETDKARILRETLKLQQMPDMPLVEDMKGVDRGKQFLRYEHPSGVDPSEVLGSLLDWEAKTFPYSRFIAENPRFTSAILEVDQSADMPPRGMPRPEEVIMFASFALEGEGTFKERQIAFRDSGQVEFKDFEIIDGQQASLPDWEPMDIDKMVDLNTDLRTIDERVGAYIEKVTSE